MTRALLAVVLLLVGCPGGYGGPDSADLVVEAPDLAVDVSPDALMVPPSSLEICHAQCDASKRCGVLTDPQTANCHTACDNNRGALQDRDTTDDQRCKNAGEIRRQQLGCNKMDCNKIVACLQTIDNTCIPR